MLPSQIVCLAIQRKIASYSLITGFTLQPSGIPGTPPILVFEVAELTPELADTIAAVYAQCRAEVTLSGYRVGTLAAVLDH